MICAGLNGLGRFGQHLLHAWLANPGAVSIDYACDEGLSAQAVCELLTRHDRLDFSRAAPKAENGKLCVTRADGVRQQIEFHHCPASRAPWLGLPDMWLECSGRHPAATDCQVFLVGQTKQVLVSATCWDADQTLVMGFNHSSWLTEARVVSYGSCTVNAFVPLANWLHQAYGIQEAQVNIIHNVPAHRLAEHAHPERRSCTLEAMAPRLLPWLSPERFSIAYTLIPYTGASLIDLRFRLRTPGSRTALVDSLRAACSEVPLRARYAVLETDPGVNGALGSPFNAMFHEGAITLQGDTLYLSGYFDNENSAVRYLELVQWLASVQPVTLQ